jgi:tetratricopeptide (TPR) repeat protein
MTDTAEILASALEAHQAGRREEAETLYRQVLAENPADPTALYLCGLLNFESGRVDEAEVLLRGVVAARPAQAEGHVALADLLYWRGDYGAAIEGYRRALFVGPDNPGALINLANVLRDAGEPAAAVAAARDAVARLPDQPAALLALGGALLADGQMAEAAAGYRSALALDPTLFEARSALSLALLNAGDVLGALEAADAALAANPDQVEAGFVRGCALAALREPAAAAEALERVVALDPNRAAAHLNLGNAYTALERGKDAERCFLAALALDPQLKEAHASLGSLYILTGDPDAAERHCWLALAVDPDMVVAHQNLASLAAERGEADQARHHRQSAYAKQNLFIEPAARGVLTVLVLTTAEGGNVPHKYLLPADRYTRINWFIEFAHDGQAAELPAFDVVFNAIGDPDLAGPTRAPLEAFLKTCDKPVFNLPGRVARTHRDLLGDLLGGMDDLVVPRVSRVSEAQIAEQGLAASVARAGLSLPVLVRPIGSHGGKGLTLAEDEGDLAAAAPARGGAYATEFRDFGRDDGLYRKYRMIFVDRRPYPYHLAISDRWLVHYETADMPDHPGRIAEEKRFLADPAAAIGERAMRAVEEVGRRLDLDYAGLDFSVLSDGSVLAFEANATMLVHPEAEDGPLAHKNPAVNAILSAFQAMIGANAA